MGFACTLLVDEINQSGFVSLWIATMFMSRMVSRMTAKAWCVPCRRTQVIGPDDVRASISSRHSSISMVRVNSSATFSSSSFVTST